MKRIIILGAGGYAKTLADILKQQKEYEEIAFLDDTKKSETILGVCEDYLKFKDGKTAMYPAFGNNQARLKWLEKLLCAKIPVPTIIHQTAYVSPAAKLEQGVVVLPKAVVNTGCLVKKGCIINCGAVLDHDCVLEEGVHLCIGAMIKAENHLPRGLKIEAGQIVLNGIYRPQGEKNE